MAGAPLTRSGDHARFVCGPLAYDSGTKAFRIGEALLALTPREHAVLRVLITRSGEPLSKLEILERVFCDDSDVQPDAVEVLVHRLRKRLQGSSVGIRTLRGLGYVLDSTPRG